MKGATTSAAITVQTSRFPPPNLEVFLDPFLQALLLHSDLVELENTFRFPSISPAAWIKRLHPYAISGRPHHAATPRWTRSALHSDWESYTSQRMRQDLRLGHVHHSSCSRNTLSQIVHDLPCSQQLLAWSSRSKVVNHCTQHLRYVAHITEILQNDLPNGSGNAPSAATSHEQKDLQCAGWCANTLQQLVATLGHHLVVVPASAQGGQPFLSVLQKGNAKSFHPCGFLEGLEFLRH
mmetsp:Transcript_6424/g.13262  ORF Transcript_6424/g.13262 Transcript_6424/m.13262 type:complete len:237 (+) Transcript_6424:279-989(+)